MRKLNLRIVLIISAVIHLRITSSLLNQTVVQANSAYGICVYYYDSNRYTCDLYNAVINSPDEVLIIAGNHLPNHNDSDVQVVIHRNVSISYFNGEVLRKFTNLEYLAMAGASVSQISENAFDVCENLEQFYFGFNSLTTFPPRMLQNCVNLRHIDLYYNSLTSLPEDLFGTTTNLEIFDVASNRISSLPNGLLRNMRNLKQFIIPSNSIANIDTNLLVNAANLEKVDLSNNPISNTSVIINLLNGHWSLNSIRLDRNTFTSFDFTFFSQFTQLTGFEFGGTALTGIAWKGLPASLTSVSVSNIAEEIPKDAFSHLTNLKSLVFTGNGITNLHEDTFKRLINLNSLAIMSTRIQTIPSNIFVDQTNLKSLYLSYNNIEELPEGVFVPLVNLGLNSSAFRDDLILSGNRIRRLNANSFGYHPHLQSLLLGSNDIYEIEREIFARLPYTMDTVDLTWNNCTSAYFRFESNLYNDERLEYCFNNWAGITTTVAPGDAAKIRADMVVIWLTFILLKIKLL